MVQCMLSMNRALSSAPSNTHAKGKIQTPSQIRYVNSNQTYKKMLNTLSHRELQIKEIRYYYTPIKQRAFKLQTPPSVDKDVEQQELSFTGGRINNGTATLGWFLFPSF